VRPAVEEEEWFVPLSHFPDRAVIVWPAKMKQVNGHKFLVLGSGLPRPRLVDIFDWSEIVVAEYIWRSPLWQRLVVGQHDELSLVAIRAFLGEDGGTFRRG
jgi:hypothetical protein